MLPLLGIALVRALAPVVPLEFTIYWHAVFLVTFLWLAVTILYGMACCCVGWHIVAWWDVVGCGTHGQARRGGA